MAELAKYLTTQFKLCGVGDDPKLKELQELLGDFTFPEEIQNKIEQNILTKDVAKSHSEVHKAIKAEVLNAVDRSLVDLMSEAGFSEDDQNAIKEITNTYERPREIAKILKKKTEEQKKDKSPNPKNEEIEKQYNLRIEALNNQLKDKERELSEAQSTHEAELINYSLQNHIASKDYSSVYGKDQGALLAKHYVNEEIKAKGLQLVREDGNVTLKTSEGLPYFVNNQEIGVDEFVSGVVASKNLLATKNTNDSSSKQQVVDSDIPGMNGMDKAIQESMQGASAT